MVGTYIRFIVRYRVAVVLALAVVTALFSLQLRHLRFEIGRGAQLPQGHPFVQIQNAIAEQFGGETTIVVGIIAQDHNIFRRDILLKIKRITEGLRDTQGVIPSSVLSITSDRVKDIRRTANGFDVSPLVPDLSEIGENALARLRTRVLADKIYGHVLTASDGSGAAIIADFDDSVTDDAIVSAVRAITKPEDDNTVEIAIGGSPIVRVYAAKYTRTMAVLFPLAVLIIGLVHYEAFRTLQAMILPLVTALMSVVWALGAMGALRAPMDTWSAMTPVVILAIAAGHAVQILKRYYEEYRRTGDNHDAVVRSLCAVGPVMLTAGIIAAAGFGSLATFGVASVRVFGVLLAAGILSALVIEMTFIPACRAILPAPRGLESRRERDGRWLTAALEWISRQVVEHPRRIAISVLLLTVAGVGGALRLHVDNSLRSWFPTSSQLRKDDALLNQNLAGTSTLYVLLRGRKDGTLTRPDVVAAIWDFEKWLQKQPEIGATLSVADFIERMHDVLREAGTDSAPAMTREMIAQYLLLYSMSGPNDLLSLVDPNHRVGVLRAFAKSDEAHVARDLIDRMKTFAAARFAGLPIDVRIAGGALGVQVALNEVVVHEKIANILQVTGIIFLLSLVIFRSFVGGLLVMAPLSVAVVLNFGIMGITGTWLSIATASISAMAVSIGADFAVYLIFRIREELRRSGGDGPAAIHEALHTSGRAIFFVSSAVALGYLVLTLSGFRVWIYLGLLTAVMMVLSAIGALMLIPVLVLAFRPRFLWPESMTIGGSMVASPPTEWGELGTRIVGSDRS
jgi:predicted RND superfamily exporter protein